jgi:hypothetical protein
MPRVGFEPTIPASKRAKTVHALDHSATVTGSGRRGEVKILDPTGTRTPPLGRPVRSQSLYRLRYAI